MTITRESVLRKYHDMAQNALLCYSTNYRMDTPIKSYEDEWQEAKEECRLIDSILKDDVGIFYVEIIGINCIAAHMMNRIERISYPDKTRAEIILLSADISRISSSVISKEKKETDIESAWLELKPLYKRIEKLLNVNPRIFSFPLPDHESSDRIHSS